MHLDHRPHRQCNGRGGIFTRAVQKAGVFLLRHSTGNVCVTSALLKQDPRSGLSILCHDVFDEVPRMKRDARHDASDLDRQIHRRDLRSVVGILHDGGEAQIIRHAFAVERPACPVQNRGPHWGPIDSDVSSRGSVEHPGRGPPDARGGSGAKLFGWAATPLV